MCRHVWGVLGSLVITLLQVYHWVCRWNIVENQLIFNTVTNSCLPCSSCRAVLLVMGKYKLQFDLTCNWVTWFDHWRFSLNACDFIEIWFEIHRDLYPWTEQGYSYVNCLCLSVCLSSVVCPSMAWFSVWYVKNDRSSRHKIWMLMVCFLVEKVARQESVWVPVWLAIRTMHWASWSLLNSKLSKFNALSLEWYDKPDMPGGF